MRDVSAHAGARLFGTCLALMFLVWGVGPAHAHKVNTSFSMVFVYPDSIKVLVAIDLDNVIAGFKLPRQPGRDISRDELLEHAPKVSEYVKEKLVAKVDGKKVEWVERETATKWDERGNLYLNLKYFAALDEEPAQLELGGDFSEKFGPVHKNVAKVIVPGKSARRAAFSRANPGQVFVVGEKVPWWKRLSGFTGLGIEHIFLGGHHLMFLLALIVAGGRFRPLALVVTAFPVAHTLTLILAVYGGLSLSYRLTEALIALSIVAAVFENLWLKRFDSRWILCLFFGLVHGLGFAGVLRELGLSSSGRVSSLLAFNLGMEISLVVIVAVLVPLVAWLTQRFYQRQVVLAVSALVLLFGLGWFVEQVAGVSFMPL